MTPYHADDWLTVYQGDCRAVMAEMEPESVHCVVTSPPYWGLRDYGTATWVGGDEACDHIEKHGARRDSPGGFHNSTNDRSGTTQPNTQATVLPYKGACRKCGAIREDGQLGLESTPEAYVESMVAVFREVRRVLRSDGTVWLNLGDSYANVGRGDERRAKDASGVERPSAVKVCERCGESFEGGLARRFCSAFCGGSDNSPRADRPGRLKAKDLVGIPWRVAFALQADGWYLRSDIIWAKPNPMPESVTDRPTKSHEYLFLLTKSPRYYFDADAVRETASENTWYYAESLTVASKRAGVNPIDGGGPERSTLGSDKHSAGRNIRSVWTIATQPYPGAHFATFPRALVEPCVKAGSPEGGTVLDPFAGSGTTGMVAQSLSRKAVLIDLNGEYLTQAMGRNRDIPLGLAG